MKTNPNDPATGKDLNELFKDEEALVAAHNAFNKHLDGTPTSLESFRFQLQDSETVSVINAMMLASKVLFDHGYAPK